MENTVKKSKPSATHTTHAHWSVEHYLRLIYHRKWLVIGSVVLVSVATFLFAKRLPNVYTSETVILVDPQKVPESYIKPTVTGDIRNRLGTLSQQILSATRLQRIIDSLNLYPEERMKFAREDVLSVMRRDISVRVLSDFGGGQDLQAFRIQYSGRDPRLVAQVTNELAALFIEENLRAREQQATGTTEFLQNQLTETRKTLEEQESKLRDFKLKHIGEMPEHEAAGLQILGQLQSQLQIETDALQRAEQQRNYVQSLITAQTSGPVIEIDSSEQRQSAAESRTRVPSNLAALKTRLAQALERYSEMHPDVQRLKVQIAAEEAKGSRDPAAAREAAPVREVAPEVATDGPVASPAIMAARRAQTATAQHFNPVLQAQLRTIEEEIAKRKEEQRRLSKDIATYQAKLQAVPVREQQITALVRDYEISKSHYKQLLEKQLSAEAATQLEIRQKGERFSILDPAQPAQRPSKPNRLLINAAGIAAGFGLGLALAIGTELLGTTITTAEQVTASTGIPVLEVVPLIQTQAGRLRRKKRLILGAACGAVATVVAMFVMLFYRYGALVF